MKKRKFLDLIYTTPFIVWLLKSIASGIVSGVAVFFTKEKLEKIYKEESDEK